MIEGLRNGIRLEVERVLGNHATTEFGIITAYDPTTYSVKVERQPSGIITGWIPLKTTAVGPGFGAMYAPSLGEQVKLSFQEGSVNVPIADGMVFDNVNSPSASGTAGPPAGEWWLVHKSGSQFKFTNDGKLLLASGEEIDIGNAASAYHSLATIAIMSIFNNHVHTNGNNGANTGAPTTQMTNADFTTVLKAN